MGRAQKKRKYTKKSAYWGKAAALEHRPSQLWHKTGVPCRINGVFETYEAAAKKGKPFVCNTCGEWHVF